MMTKKIYRRSFLLFEIIIALSLFILALNHLLTPHVILFLKEKEKAALLDLDRIAYLLYSERLYAVFLQRGISSEELYSSSFFTLKHPEEEKLKASYAIEIKNQRNAQKSMIVELRLRLKLTQGKKYEKEYRFYFPVIKNFEDQEVPKQEDELDEVENSQEESESF